MQSARLEQQVWRCETARLIRFRSPQRQPEPRLPPGPQPRLPSAAVVNDGAVAQLRFSESLARWRAVLLVFLQWFFFRPALWDTSRRDLRASTAPSLALAVPMLGHLFSCPARQE